MRRNDHGVRIWWTAALLGLAVACGGTEQTPQPSGPAMSAPPNVEDRDENAAPVVEQLFLNPRSPLPGTAVEASVEVRDPDGDPYRLSFDWKINGEVAASGPRPRFMLEDVQKGDRIAVTVVATDGRLESEPWTERTRIGNRPPLLQGVLLDPQETVRSGDDLLASPQATDADDDPLDYQYTWLVNGSETGQRGREFSTRGLERGDKVRVRVVASDGSDSSRPAESREITLGNSPPLIKEIPGAQADDGMFRYSFEAEDPDGDRNLRFRLGKAPEGMRIDPILGVATWRPKESQAGVHPVEVIVQDSQGDGSALHFEVTVTATLADSADQPPAAAR